MAKVKIEFELDTYEDEYLYSVITQAEELATCLSYINDRIRTILKYKLDVDMNQDSHLFTYEQVYDYLDSIRDIINDSNIKGEII